MSKWYEKSDWEKECEKQAEIESIKGTVIPIVIISFIVIAALVVLTFVFGWFGVGYTKTVKKAQTNAEREVFKVSKPYVEGMLSDLAKYKFEFTTEKDLIAKKAIIELIIEKYGNFDSEKIEDFSIKSFLQDVRAGKYNNLEDK